MTSRMGERTGDSSSPSPPHVHLFSWEKGWQTAQLQGFMLSMDFLPWTLVVVYVLVVHSLRAYMRTRKPMDLRPVLVLWNLVLVAFSFLGSLRMAVTVGHGIKQYGMHYTICGFRDPDKEDIVGYLWSVVFAYSKFVELGDTFFIVLRKKKLIFLHWYHHSTALLFAWITSSRVENVGAYFCLMNSLVHTAMYSYFLVTAVKVKVPAKSMMALTGSQILQMFCGLLICSYILVQKISGESCNLSYFSLAFGFLTYFTFLILFLNFFVHKYLLSEKSAKMLEFINSKNYLPWLAVVVYIVSIYILSAYMKNRPAFSLRKLLVTWNAFLALFSLVATVRVGVSLLYSTHHFGFGYATCAIGRAEEDPIALMWTIIFSFSKILEFGDTYFILLRKQKLIFLHWYHHASVLLFTWYNTARAEEAGAWFSVMNGGVHTIMYFYYFLRALKISVPRGFMMFITISQIAQMVFGMMLCGYITYTKMLGYPCNMSNPILTSAVLMYLSYFVLFVDFFRKTYRKPQAVLKRRKSSSCDVKNINGIQVISPVKRFENGDSTISRRKSLTGISYTGFSQG
ncbi:unnamed protein product [Darwinula stevensoni]|uniref:Elongation of very long chain fatty acids protein n=1 Tax=Darwinula stevensoni TaxID=69355 RepID=A0A7R8X5H5_9CRUS|nr:unnamed protein product [Darwinula stevensoni]CAG0885957.1 unnamed protein product [Darwinula stevensoni]